MYQITILHREKWKFETFFSRLPTLEEYKNYWRNFRNRYPHFHDVKEVCEVLESCESDPFTNGENALCRDRDITFNGETTWISFLKVNVINLP